MQLYQDLLSKKEKLSLIGLGYVGLPIALEFAKKTSVIGFDINRQRIEMMKKHSDPSNELEPSDFEGTDIVFTANPDDLKEAKFHIIAVPTPIDEHNMPDLSPLVSASKTVGAALKKGDYVVYESTVYPGATEEDCVPILESMSGLKVNEDFKVGFSPERINPGDKEHTIRTITKVVSGSDAESLELIARVYELVVDAGIHKASSIKVAEAAKIIENTQRDVNIALMNELSMIFNKMNINTFEVLQAAGTKWNFLRFFPGLVGGHCIGVDPYYLTYKANIVGHRSKIITAGRTINDRMGKYIATEIVKKIILQGANVLESKVLILGTTFKEDVSDIRNSKVVDVYNELKSYSLQIDVADPYADKQEVEEEYGYTLIDKPEGKYNAVVLAVAHEAYKNLNQAYFANLLVENGILFDVKGLYRNLENDLIYMSL
jgi:UDP-N-acetyl-D-galactosamine dehydrogenase